MPELWLQILAEGLSIAQPLPANGRLTLGRAEDSDVRIDDSSVSRRHAILHVGTKLQIEDLGSANGTTLRGVRRGGDKTGTMVETRLRSGEPTAISIGDVVTLGSVVMVVQTGKPRSAPPTNPTPVRAPAHGVVVSDVNMRRVFDLVQRVAQGDISVLLLGETGVGKDVVAQALHEASPRAGKPLLRLNCAALSEPLLESELFGYERGAFTGAVAAKPGLLEIAAGGTVFLDEVGELPMSTQAKLLRVLEDRRVMPVGALKARPIDVRFVSATNRDLESESDSGRFRRDLYYRLNGVSLGIPPLRERRGEIEALLRSFLKTTCARLGTRVPEIDPRAMALLQKHSWPGNVRELRNVVERAALLAGNGPIGIEHLHLSSAATALPPTSTTTPQPAVGGGGAARPLRNDVEELERQRIIDALEQCVGNQTHAAKMLGMPRRTFIKRLESYGIPRPRKR